MFCEQCDRVNEKLGIDIDLFFSDLDQISPTFNSLNDIDRQIICASLLGKERDEIANLISRKGAYVKDRLSNYIYAKIATLMSVDQSKIAGKWTIILNWLLDPEAKYRLYPSTQLNADNFQASFGRQVFLYAHDREIGNAQISGTKYYQSGSWYLAQKCFLFAWNKGQELFNSGSPEILIYINNCAIERNQHELVKQKITIYTIAVVVPVHHDRGQIAIETLQGIAQMQLQINAQIRELELAAQLSLTSFPLVKHKIALKVLIVNDINNLHDGYDRTAENLVKLAPNINLIAVVGHYSSEATKRALPVYAQAGIVLVNSSSTSNHLSSLEIGEQLCFFRIPPMDIISAASLVHFLSLSNTLIQQPQQKKVAIIYAKNSIYSNSYRQSIETEIGNRPKDFELLSTFGYLNEDDIKSSNYINQINQAEVDIIIVVIDARIDPNFLANTGLSSEIDLSRCILAGSATLYKQNFNPSVLNCNPQIFASLPWHWDSLQNGNNSKNILANNFCNLAASLWNAQKVTWRSATAFDSVLLIHQVLQHFPQTKNSKDLLEQMDRYLKVEKNPVEGVTGKIEFQANGDRLQPPTEIVKINRQDLQQKWQWDCLPHQ
jgi:branched-chain amino acid transport system substrate-binding protein